MNCKKCNHPIELVNGKWMHKWRYKVTPNICQKITHININHEKNTATIIACQCHTAEGE